MDGLSYLHWRSICHLDIQPDNVVMASNKFCSVKLVDFGSAQTVAISKSDIPFNGLLDYVGKIFTLLFVCGHKIYKYTSFN